MKYFIFGGSGFVGHALTKALLAEGKEVCVCDLVRDKRINDVRGGRSFLLISRILPHCGRCL